MKMSEVLSNLCYRDKRNPDNYGEGEELQKNPCFCDNCFYGRTPLALEIIKLSENKS